MRIMEQISFYLNRFKVYGFKQVRMQELIAEAVSKELGIPIGRELVSYNEGEVRIKISGAAKAQMFLKKEAVRGAIEQALDVFQKRVHSVR
jgi:hypothetical protein